MRYSDVAKKYYKDTKNRIFENVLAAEGYSGERSENKTNGEKKNKEKIIMTNSTARIRKSRNVIAAACALVMLGSSAFVMNKLKTADDRAASSRPDKVKSTVVTSSDEDISSEVSEEDNYTIYDSDNSEEEKSAEKNSDSGRSDTNEKPDKKEVKENASSAAEKNDDIRQTDDSTDVTTAVNDSSQPETSSDASDESQQAESTADIDYSLDEDSYVDEAVMWDLNVFNFIGEGTVTSKDIYGRTANEDFKPLNEYTEDEIGNVRRLYFRCAVRLDGKCIKGEELMPYLSQTPDYDPVSGDMMVDIPIAKTYGGDDIFAGNYAASLDEVNDIDLYNVGEKLLLEFYVRELDDGWTIDGNDTYRYDPVDKVYHQSAFYIPTMKEVSESKDSMTNYITNTLKGGTPEAAEQWVSHLGESYTIKYIPSKRFASGEVVNVDYSFTENCYVICVAE